MPLADVFIDGVVWGTAHLVIKTRRDLPSAVSCFFVSADRGRASREFFLMKKIVRAVGKIRSNAYRVDLKVFPQ